MEPIKLIPDQDQDAVEALYYDVLKAFDKPELNLSNEERSKLLIFIGASLTDSSNEFRSVVQDVIIFILDKLDAPEPETTEDDCVVAYPAKPTDPSLN